MNEQPRDPRPSSAVDAAVAVYVARFGSRPLPPSRDALVELLMSDADPADANVVVDVLRQASWSEFCDAVVSAQHRGRS